MGKGRMDVKKEEEEDVNLQNKLNFTHHKVREFNLLSKSFCDDDDENDRRKKKST